jgi:hypothetical protein
MTLASRLAPAVSHGPDSGSHGGHCYVDGTLVCGWPGEHLAALCGQTFLHGAHRTDVRPYWCAGNRNVVVGR